MEIFLQGKLESCQAFFIKVCHFNMQNTEKKTGIYSHGAAMSKM